MLLSTSSLAGYGLHKIFLLAKNAGYEGIDLSVDWSLYDTFDSRYLKELMDQIGLSIISLSAPERRFTKKQFDDILKLAHDLDIGIVNVHPPHRLDREKDWFGDYMKIIGPKYPSITINVINAPPKTWLFIISEYGDARPETIKKITEHTALSIDNVDPTSGVDLMKTSILLGSTMGLIYVSDKDDNENGLFPGEGTMPLESFLIKIKEFGYTGLFSLSVSPKSLGAGEGDEVVIERMREAHNFVTRYFH